MTATSFNAGIIWAFSDTALETWLKNCEWGSSPFGARFDAWKTQPELAYYELMGLLNNPTVAFRDRDDDDRDIILQVHTQGFNLKQGELELELEYETGKGNKGILTLTADNKSGKKLATNAKQKVTSGITPSLFWYYARIKLLRQPKSSGIVDGLEIHLNRQMFAELKGQGDIKLTAHARVWPIGTGQTLSRYSSVLYSLPAPEFNSSGQPIIGKTEADKKKYMYLHADTEIELKRTDKVLPAPIRSDDDKGVNATTA